MGSVQLTELLPPHISAFYEKLAADGLSIRSVWCVHLLLRRILDDACKSGIIEAYPADYLEVPIAETKQDFQLRASQIRRYLNAAEDSGVLSIIYIGLRVGLRQCELFTLLWSDFDLQRRYILRGRRLLPLDEKEVALLKSEHERHPESPYAFLNRPGIRFACTNFIICIESSPNRHGFRGWATWRSTTIWMLPRSWTSPHVYAEVFYPSCPPLGLARIVPVDGIDPVAFETTPGESDALAAPAEAVFRSAHRTPFAAFIQRA